MPKQSRGFWRWTLASLVIAPFSWRYFVRDLPVIKKHLPILLLLAFLGVGSFNTLLYSGLQYTQALNSVLLQTLLSAIVLVLSRVLFGVKIRALQVLGVAIAFIGAAIIIFKGSLTTLLNFRLNPGDIIILLAVVLYAGYTVLLQKRPKIHPLSFVFATFILGAPMILPFYVFESVTVRPVHLNSLTLLSFLYVAIFPSILSYLFYNRGVELVGANQAGLIAYMSPVFGTVLAIVFLGESFKVFHAFGILLIFLGVFIATRIRPQRS